MRDTLPGIVFALALVGLAGLAVADLTVTLSSQRSGFDYGGLYASDEHVVYAKSVVMRPGDRLSIAPNVAGGWPLLTGYDFYVVNGGDRYALLDGNATRATYVEVKGMTTQGCCPNHRVVWDRVGDELSQRAPREAVATGPGIDVDMRELEMSLLDHPDRMDLVWVFQYGPNVTAPQNEEERRALEARIEPTLDGSFVFHPAFGPGHPTVYSAGAVAAKPYLLLGLSALAVLGAGSAILWGVRMRRARFDPEGPGTESLLRLYDAAGDYLASLRDLMIGSLLVVLGVALHVALLGEPQPMYTLMKASGLGGQLWPLLSISLALLYGAVITVWAYAGWSVQRALRRWRKRGTAQALEV